MYRSIILFTVTTILATTAVAQEDEIYFDTGGEFIFSWASVNNDGVEGGVITRFSAFFHLQLLASRDFNRNFGAFWGLSMRNIGFIYDVPDSANTRKKYRNYTLGIPVGIKLGNLNRTFMYTGYELEIPINYKEKTFVNEKKVDKFNVWFSDRSPSVYHTLFVGLQSRRGLNLKLKYYFTNFFNQDFEENIAGTIVKPFENFQANVFYISLNIDLFRNTSFYLDDEWRPVANK